MSAFEQVKEWLCDEANVRDAACFFSEEDNNAITFAVLDANLAVERHGFPLCARELERIGRCYYEAVENALLDLAQLKEKK